MSATKEIMRKRFEGKYIPEPNSGCWLWTGATVEKGYGLVAIDPRPKQTFRRAHRVAWELYRGPIPDGQIVCHKCDVRCCVNPDHLFLGTHSDNMQDCVRKGRMYVPVWGMTINEKRSEARHAV